MATREERDYLSQYIDIAGSHLNDSDVEWLMRFINSVGNRYTEEGNFDSWGSDGKYTRNWVKEYIIESDYSLTSNYSYKDDDGTSGSYSENITNARDIINIIRENPHLL